MATKIHGKKLSDREDGWLAGWLIGQRQFICLFVCVNKLLQYLFFEKCFYRVDLKKKNKL